MQTLTSLELEFHNNLWELVNSIRSRLPLKESNLQTSLIATVHELETLKGCAEILSFEPLIKECTAMAEVVVSGMQGEREAGEVSEALLFHLDSSLMLLCSR